MKNYLSSADLAMWIALIAGKLVLCLCILKKHFFSRLPWFSALIFASSIKSLLLLALAFWASYSAYYYAFYISSYIESALMFLTLIECGRQVLPGLNLPQKEKALCLVAGLHLGPCSSLQCYGHYAPLPRKRIEVGAYLAIGRGIHLYRCVLTLPGTLLVTVVGWNNCHSWLAVSG